MPRVPSDSWRNEFTLDSVYIALVFKCLASLSVQIDTDSHSEHHEPRRGKEFSIVYDHIIVREFDSNKQFHLDDRRSPRQRDQLGSGEFCKGMHQRGASHICKYRISL